ncbi:MAG: FtsH protease activity modulator HflK [Alphaproteobacteria bacterium]|nr:FtsH protease activity modulator HflK [Alphaproteobacteria bacterium]
MSDNDPQGPWGSNGKKSSGGGAPESPNPWTRKSAGPDEPLGSPLPPPDFDELWDKLKGWLGPRMPEGRLQAVAVIFGVIVCLWLLSGIYQVAADQVGVVMRFGAYERTEKPGLHYHFPYPIEDVLLPVVTSQNEIPVGFRHNPRQDNEMQNVPQESMMLTQDENVINVEFTVFWRISDPSKFLFEIRNPQQTVKMAAESVMREVIGQNKLQFALTDGRGQIAEETRLGLQSLMDEYNAGVVITQINLQTVSVPDEVKAAFQDVVNARLDQERFQNQAAAHVNKVIPDAKGRASQLVQQAMAYRDQKIALAKGEADRFKEVLTAYNVSHDVTAKRLYLETMESVLGNARKVIVEKSAGGASIPYFPLTQLTRGQTPSSNEGDRP